MKEFFFRKITKYLKGKDKKPVKNSTQQKDVSFHQTDRREETIDQDFLDLFTPDDSVGTLQEVMEFKEDEAVSIDNLTQLPIAFQWAEQTSAQVSQQLRKIDLSGFASVGQALSGLTNIIGSCGVVCSHSLGAVANAGSSLSSLSGVSGSMGGLNFDGKGNVSFNGNIGELARRTGLSSSDITSGKYSTEDLLTLLIQSFGKGIENVMGIGLIHCVLDGFIPTPVRSSD